jgi:hypothetical protein
MTPSDLLDRVREICFELSDVTEKVAWGAPTFRVRGKMFAMFVDNHHGDGRIAVWCNAPLGLQETMVRSFPRRFFVPPYVGPQGWVGLRLDVDVDWVEVSMVLEEAHRKSAPARKKGKAVRARTSRPAAAAEPLVTADALRSLALRMPGVVQGTSYGTPAWRAGGKLFARMLTDPDTVVLRTDPARRDELMRRDPETFFITDHYRDYPWVIVRLSRTSPDELRRLLEDAIALSKPARRRGPRAREAGPRSAVGPVAAKLRRRDPAVSRSSRNHER